MDRFVVISGCSGGGKSTLLAELGRRGHTVIEEPGRRIVIEEMNGGGSVPHSLGRYGYLCASRHCDGSG
jgi:predicted ATPase